MNPLTAAVHGRYKQAFNIVPRDVRGFDLGALHLDVVIFDDLPCTGARTLATAGLGSHVGQELLFSCLIHQFVPDAVKLVGSVARQLFVRAKGFHEGEVLGPSGPILPRVRAEALLAFKPVYFGDVLDEAVIGADGSHIHFFWLVPLLGQEAKWIQRHDASAFADILEHQDPNLLDLCRDPIELA